MKGKTIQFLRLLVQLFFLVGLTTSLMWGFMTLWPGVLMAVFLLSAVAGNFYCGWICPFGTVQDWLGKLGSLFIKRKPRMPRKIQQVLQFSKYLIYALILLGGALGIVGALSQSSSFNANYYFLTILNTENTAQLGQYISVPVWIFLSIYLVTALFFDRPFCNYLCPDAINYSMLSFLRVFTIRRNESRCVGCNKCNRACLMQIDVAHTHNLRNANCINCMKCVGACPVKDTLSYGLIQKQTVTSSAMQFLKR